MTSNDKSTSKILQELRDGLKDLSPGRLYDLNGSFKSSRLDRFEEAIESLTEEQFDALLESVKYLGKSQSCLEYLKQYEKN